MVTVLQAAGFTVTAVLIAKLIQRYAAEQALMLILLAGTLLTLSAVWMMMPILNQIDDLLSAGGLLPEQTAAISKAIGICCITQLASDLCKDAGETAPAAAVLLIGRIALILLVLPLLDPLLNELREVLSCVSCFGS